MAAHASLWRYIITKASLGALILRSLTAQATFVPRYAASFMEKQSAAIQQGLQTRVENFLDQQMDVVGEKFKGLVKDPYMPIQIQSTIDDFVDVLLPDIKLALFTKTNEYISAYRAKRSPRRRRASEAPPFKKKQKKAGKGQEEGIMNEEQRKEAEEQKAEMEIDRVLDSLMEDVDEDSDYGSQDDLDLEHDDDDDDDDEEDADDDDGDGNDGEESEEEESSGIDSSSETVASTSGDDDSDKEKEKDSALNTFKVLSLSRRAGQARRLCWRWHRRWMRRSKRRQRSSVCFKRPTRATIRRTARGVRAWTLYTLAPFDRSFWRSIRNPWYIVLQIVGLIPGLGMLWWLFIFVLHDKRDEFQLSQFIVGFQAAKFFSQGCFNLIRGAFFYFICANRLQPTCDTDGPMVKYLDALFFAVQIIIVWLTFFILPYSEPCRAVNDPRDAHLLDEARTDRNQAALRAKVRLGRGGRLRHLFWWDTVAVCLVLALSAVAYFIVELRGWQLRSTLYWLSTIYGLTAMPFILFKLPIMGNLLTPTKATGYTRKGYTVLRVIPPPPRPLLEYQERLLNMNSQEQSREQSQVHTANNEEHAEDGSASEDGGMHLLQPEDDDADLDDDSNSNGGGLHAKLLPITEEEPFHGLKATIAKLSSPISGSSVSTELSHAPSDHSDEVDHSASTLDHELSHHGRFFLPDKYEQRYGDYHEPEEEESLQSPTSQPDYARVGIQDVTAEVAARTNLNHTNSQLLFNLRRLRSSSSLFDDARSAYG